jgi:hypothetical protein
VSVVSVHDLNDLLAVTADNGPVRLGFDRAGQYGRVHQIGEHDGQSADLARVLGCREQVLGVGISAVCLQHSACQCVGSSTIAPIDRVHGPIEQRIGRATVSPRSHLSP